MFNDVSTNKVKVNKDNRKLSILKSFYIIKNSLNTKMKYPTQTTQILRYYNANKN